MSARSLLNLLKELSKIDITRTMASFFLSILDNEFNIDRLPIEKYIQPSRLIQTML